MPQPSSPPAESSAPKVPEFDASNPAQSYAAVLITQAMALERERAGVMEKVGANRTELRLIDKQGNLSDEQGEWLDTWYPEKEKGERRSKDDIEATRKAREAARKAKAA